MDIETLIRMVMDCAMRVRRQLAPGYEEKIYQTAMAIELKKSNIPFQKEAPVDVVYDDMVIGSYRCDFIVEDRLIVEVKATSTLVPANHVQIVNYLKATGIDDGLLINFGSQHIEIKRKYRLFRQTQQ